MNAWKIVLIAALVLAALAVLAVVIRPGAVPPVTDGAGRPVEGSLAVWEPVNIGGVR